MTKKLKTKWGESIFSLWTTSGPLYDGPLIPKPFVKLYIAPVLIGLELQYSVTCNHGNHP